MPLLKLRKPPEWGVQPVPAHIKRLGFLDLFALWSSLGVGLLVLLAGSILVPSLGLLEAVAISLLGSVIGSVFLALVGVMGDENSVPTMILLRPSLGIRGSYIPSILNIIQLIGWTAFELTIMAQAADKVSSMFLGFSNYYMWLLFFTLFCVVLAIGGPLVVVREWIEKFAIWLVYIATAWITFYILTSFDYSALPRPTGELPVLLAMDIVLAMPISWFPLVSDYNRFSRDRREGFLGTFIGYTIANTWFYSLGALSILVLRAENLITAILSVSLGGLALIAILVDETDNAFADIYSAAVSLQNLFTKSKQWILILSISFIGFLLAATVQISQYEFFLLWIGSVFIPLFGVVLADYFFVRSRKYVVEQFYDEKGMYWYFKGFNLRAVFSWVIGVITYYYIVYMVPWLGASIPSLFSSFIVYLLLATHTSKEGEGN